VWAQFVNAIRSYSSAPNLEPGQAGTDGRNGDWRLADNWQWKAIADLFRPVCFLTGRCEFKANFDRPCSIREDVEFLGRDGVPSADWDEYIKPGRWLLDPRSAGRRV
jgi:hypothetical protein